ncbi:MAG: hypothetical protein LLG97_10210 [Deltaproteobacteria bacterium]|nr:hypothetical protein [Deltaproteobacteria bacterium]
MDSLTALLAEPGSFDWTRKFCANGDRQRKPATTINPTIHKLVQYCELPMRLLYLARTSMDTI